MAAPLRSHYLVVLKAGQVRQIFQDRLQLIGQEREFISVLRDLIQQFKHQLVLIFEVCVREDYLRKDRLNGI